MVDSKTMVAARTASPITRIELTLNKLSTTTMANVTATYDLSNRKQCNCQAPMRDAIATPVLVDAGLEKYEKFLKSVC